MPDWKEDELVLAADLVSRNDWTGLRSTTPAAIALSQLLAKGQLHRGELLPEGFRSPASIQRKTYDLATADDSYKGKPTRGGKMVGPVMRAFRADTAGMQQRAAAIRSVLEAGDAIPTTRLEDGDLDSEEGGILEYLARRRERDPRIRLKKLVEVRAACIPLACEVCGFDFGHVYGDRGEGYIEVHHVTPLHVSGPVTTRSDGLALLCANCHRMCHRGPWLTPDDVRALIKNQR